MKIQDKLTQAEIDDIRNKLLKHIDENAKAAGIAQKREMIAEHYYFRGEYNAFTMAKLLIDKWLETEATQ
jgi:hypothetical protein